MTADDPDNLILSADSIGDPCDPSVLDAFSRTCDVVTFDHENIDPEVIDALARLGRVVRPGASSFRLCDKAAQRTQLTTLGFAVLKPRMYSREVVRERCLLSAAFSTLIIQRC